MYKHAGNYNGTPSPDQARRLKRHKRTFIDNLKNSKEIIQQLFNQRVMNLFDSHKITYAASAEDAACSLTEVMLTKTSEGFCLFLRALGDTGNSSLQHLLSDEDGDALQGDSDAARHGVDEDNEGGRVPEDAPMANLIDTTVLGPQPPGVHNLNPSLSLSRDNQLVGIQADDRNIRIANEEQHLLTRPGDQHEIHTKVAGLEARVETLTESMQGVERQLQAGARRAEEGDKERAEHLQRLEDQLLTRETLLCNASRDIQDLRAKIEVMERQKDSALAEASQDIAKMNEVFQQNTQEKRRLEDKVRQLSAENEELKRQIEEISREKDAVVGELRKQSKRMEAIESENKTLREKQLENEMKIQFVIQKVGTLDMTAGSNLKKTSRGSDGAPARKISPSVVRAFSSGSPTTAHAHAHSAGKGNICAKAPGKQRRAKANSKKQ